MPSAYEANVTYFCPRTVENVLDLVTCMLAAQMIHHTLELPFYILRYGSETGKQLYVAKQAAGSSKQRQRHAAVPERQAVPAVLEVEDEEAALQPNSELQQTNQVGRTADTAATMGPVDDFSSIGALRELLQLNREVMKRLGELEEHSSFKPSGPSALGQNSNVDPRKLSASELTRLVDEQQLTVGMSSPPVRQSNPGDASSKAMAQPSAPSRATKPRRVPPIDNPSTVQHPEQHQPLTIDATQAQTASRLPAIAVARPTSGRNDDGMIVPRKTPSPPILKEPGGPIVHENAPTIAFSSEVTTKEITPVKPLARSGRTNRSAEPTPTSEAELEPGPELEPDKDPAAGWLRGTTKAKGSKVVPTLAASSDTRSKGPTRIQTRTRVKREP